MIAGKIQRARAAGFDNRRRQEFGDFNQTFN
jgi:hypothetical protein